MPKHVYSTDQISAVCALGALRPKPSSKRISAITGVPHATVRYYTEGRCKYTPTDAWVLDVIEAVKAHASGKPHVAAYYFVSAAKRLMKETKP